MFEVNNLFLYISICLPLPCIHAQTRNPGLCYLRGFNFKYMMPTVIFGMTVNDSPDTCTFICETSICLKAKHAISLTQQQWYIPAVPCCQFSEMTRLSLLWQDRLLERYLSARLQTVAEVTSQRCQISDATQTFGNKTKIVV